MISRIHQKLGTAGFVISIVALVVAMSGAAYAAKGALTGKQKKEVEKIAKKYAGKPGAPGAPGATGPAGVKGDAGATGEKGDAGTAGVNGKSVTVTAIAAGGSKCEERAGAEVKVEGAATGTPVCDGKAGAGTLAPGATESGVWSLGQLPSLEGADAPQFNYVPITFPSPLPEGEAPLTVVFMPERLNPVTEEQDFAEPTAQCPGTAEDPQAAEGFMCVYATPNVSKTATLIGASNPSGVEPTPGAGPNGTVLNFKYQEFAKGIGTWAATARS